MSYPSRGRTTRFRTGDLLDDVVQILGLRHLDARTAHGLNAFEGHRVRVALVEGVAARIARRLDSLVDAVKGALRPIRAVPPLMWKTPSAERTEA